MVSQAYIWPAVLPGARIAAGWEVGSWLGSKRGRGGVETPPQDTLACQISLKYLI